MKLFGLFAALIPCFVCATYVSCDLYGQLGNQLFQVAAALSYALEHGAEARFPHLESALGGHLNARYIFHRVNQSEFPADTLFVLHDHDRITDSFHYAALPEIEQNNVWIHGHFCSEKYFKKHASFFKKLFSPSEEILETIYRQYANLFNQPTVAVHIRTFRPDHHSEVLHVPDSLRTLRWFYYRQAMSLFPSSSRFLIFSDDIDWVKAHFPPTQHNVVFIEGNPHYIDFYMISLCDHQIVAPDSTFSWWAAWLNPNPNKRVILADTFWKHPDADIIAEGWHPISRFPRGVFVPLD